MKKPKKRTLTVSEKQIAYGMFGGLLIGIFTDNIGLWLSLGLVFGAAPAVLTRIAKKKRATKIATSDIVNYLCKINHRYATISNTKY